MIFCLLLVEGEQDDFDLLLRDCVADELNGEFVVGPVLACEAVKDGTSVAVIL